MAENVVEFTDDNFDTEVLKSEVPVLVDFWAEWCGPCRMVGPIIDELSKNFEGKAMIYYLLHLTGHYCHQLARNHAVPR